MSRGLGYERDETAAPHTLCQLLERSEITITVDGTARPARDYAQLARQYGRGFLELGYPPGSLVLLALRSRAEDLAVTLGAWWSGHHVAHTRAADHVARDRLAVRIGAALQVCAESDIVDEEHIRHRTVPAEPAVELLLPAMRDAPRCSAADPALLRWYDDDAKVEVVTHRDLLRAEHGPDIGPAGVECMIRAVALALVSDVSLRLDTPRPDVGSRGVA